MGVASKKKKRERERAGGLERWNQGMEMLEGQSRGDLKEKWPIKAE